MFLFHQLLLTSSTSRLNFENTQYMKMNAERIVSVISKNTIDSTDFTIRVVYRTLGVCGCDLERGRSFQIRYLLLKTC